MKRNKVVWIVIPVVTVLIAAVVAAAFLLISSQKKESRYYEQMNAAKKYLEDADYSKMIEAYEEAIALNPEEPEPYMELAQYYLDTNNYYDASAIAAKGWENTSDDRLNELIDYIESVRLVKGSDMIIGEIQADDIQEVDESISEETLVRNNMIGIAAEYCYQQYINEYGDATVSYVSAEEGYKVKFKGLNVHAYFKDTQENKNIIDEYAKKPNRQGKPYKIIFYDPDIIFVKFNNYVTNNKLAQMFNLAAETKSPVQEGETYYLQFEYLGCMVKIETDANGNISKEKPVIELQPLNLYSDWEEEEEVVEEEPEEVIDDGTFVLAGQTYSYDITELVITGENLDDLGPLADCKKLTYILFNYCDIDDLSPLSGCSALVELNLNGSSGNMDLSCLAGLSRLRYLGFHECKDIDDISGIMDLELDILHPCASSVSYEQCEEYQRRHPNCQVWFDYYYPVF